MKRIESLTRRLVLTTSWVISKFIDLCRIKPKTQALLTSFPDYDDQILSMAMELSKAKVPIVVLYNGIKQVPKPWFSDKLKLKHVRKNSLRAIYHAKRSKYIFYTHGFILSESKSKEQVVVNLWHGIPLKKIGFELGNKMPKSDYIVATSRETAYLVEQTYSPTEVIPEILYYGLPRLDLIELETSRAPATNFLWMPTFRSSKIGNTQYDGYIDSIGIGMSEADLRNLDVGLAQLGINVELLLHPMANANIPRELSAIKESSFRRDQDSLYCYLNRFDALITDYSSISIDFLVTQKPIYLLALDYAEYNDSRGLFGKLELLLGLPVFKTIQEFLDVLGPPRKDMPQLKLALNKWHDYRGNERSRHIWERIQ